MNVRSFVAAVKVPVPPEQELCISACLRREIPFPWEEDGLHFLAADFTHQADVGMKLFGRRHRHHFLHHLAPHERRNDARARSGKEDTARVPVSGHASTPTS
jgi:hypothetical protein